MKRKRKTNIITIMALLVAIVGMSLGFAVFSNVLTISSRATVNPSADNCFVSIYGIEQEVYAEDIGSDVSTMLPYFTSKTTSVSIPGVLNGTSLIPYDASPATSSN